MLCSLSVYIYIYIYIVCRPKDTRPKEKPMPGKLFPGGTAMESDCACNRLICITVIISTTRIIIIIIIITIIINMIGISILCIITDTITTNMLIVIISYY